MTIIPLPHAKAAIEKHVVNVPPSCGSYSQVLEEYDFAYDGRQMPIIGKRFQFTHPTRDATSSQ